MEVKLDEFRRAFDWVDVVDKSPALPTSRYVRMVGTGTELELYLSGITIAMARCQALGELHCGVREWYASRPHLGSFLGAADGDVVTVSCDGNVLRLSCGEYSMELQQVHETLNYYDWDGSGDVLQLPSIVVGSMAMLSRYAARSPGLEHLSAIRLTSGFGAFASDNVALVGLCSQAVDATCTIPVELAATIAKLKTAEVRYSQAGCGVVTDYGYLFQPRHFRLDKMPANKMADLLKRGMDVPAEVVAPVADLHMGLRRVSKAASRGAVSLKSSGDQLTIAVAEQDVKVSYRFKLVTGGEFAVSIGLPHILPFVNHIAELGATTIQFAMAENCAVARSTVNGHTYVLMVAARA